MVSILDNLPTIYLSGETFHIGSYIVKNIKETIICYFSGALQLTGLPICNHSPKV